MADAKLDRMNRRSVLALGGGVAGGLLSATAGFVPATASAADGAEPVPALVLNGVTIVDTRDGKLRRDMTIVIESGKIAKIAPASSGIANRAGRIVDARGTYVVPGYNDFHAHPLTSSDPEGSLALMLANGVTGFREMASAAPMLAARAQGTLLPATAPELLELASEPVNPGNSPVPAAAVAHVQNQKAGGADFIKVIDYSPDVFFAVAAECKRQNLRFTGHLSPAVDVREALRAGMRSIEHMGPRDSVLLGCSTEEAALRPVPAPPKPPAGGPPSEAALKRGLVNPALATSPEEVARYQRVLDSYSDARRRDLAAKFVAAGTWMVPTLIRVRTMLIGDAPEYRSDPNLQYLPAQTRATWEEISQQFGARFAPAQHATLQQLYARLATLVKPFKDSGVPMMTGSDLGGGFVVAGFGLHAEFDLLAAAGLAPLDVLQMTTVNGAKFLGRESRMGSVAEGKDANLVLLRANPMESVQNLHRIAAVVRAGTFYSSGALAAMKKKTADRVASGVAFREPLLPPCC